ncbi:MAG: hypothetical protein KIT83_21155, partial [Bryobacterales bacterium]|nr:hypothetical protein [Bryobacterales bacterium]
MTFRSIRFRLTCWYLAALSLSLALFGTSVWFVMRDQMVQNRMESIDRRLEALGQFLEREALADDLPAIVEEAREYS